MCDGQYGRIGFEAWLFFLPYLRRLSLTLPCGTLHLSCAEPAQALIRCSSGC